MFGEEDDILFPHKTHVENVENVEKENTEKTHIMYVNKKIYQFENIKHTEQQMDAVYKLFTYILDNITEFQKYKSTIKDILVTSEKLKNRCSTWSIQYEEKCTLLLSLLDEVVNLLSPPVDNSIHTPKLFNFTSRPLLIPQENSLNRKKIKLL